MNKDEEHDEMREEYDLRGGVRGKYYERYRAGTNIIVLDADVAKIFRDSETVNTALRQFVSDHGVPAPAEKHTER